MTTRKGLWWPTRSDTWNVFSHHFRWRRIKDSAKENSQCVFQGCSHKRRHIFTLVTFTVNKERGLWSFVRCSKYKLREVFYAISYDISILKVGWKTFSHWSHSKGEWRYVRCGQWHSVAGSTKENPSSRDYAWGSHSESHPWKGDRSISIQGWVL